jgi:hypothetical protein
MRAFENDTDSYKEFEKNLDEDLISESLSNHFRLIP